MMWKIREQEPVNEESMAGATTLKEEKRKNKSSGTTMVPIIL